MLWPSRSGLFVDVSHRRKVMLDVSLDLRVVENDQESLLAFIIGSKVTLSAHISSSQRRPLTLPEPVDQTISISSLGKCVAESI